MNRINFSNPGTGRWRRCIFWIQRLSRVCRRGRARELSTLVNTASSACHHWRETRLLCLSMRNFLLLFWSWTTWAAYCLARSQLKEAAAFLPKHYYRRIQFWQLRTSKKKKQILFWDILVYPKLKVFLQKIENLKTTQS